MTATATIELSENAVTFDKFSPEEIRDKLNNLIQETINSIGARTPGIGDIKNSIDFIGNCLQRSIIITDMAIKEDGALHMLYKKGQKVTGIVFQSNQIHYSITYNGIYQYSDNRNYDAAKLNSLYANMS